MKKLLAILIVIGVGFLGYAYTSTPASGDEQGGIHIEVIDQNGDMVIDDYFDFENEMTLFDLLSENYTIACADSSYNVDYTCEYEVLNNHMILAIEGVETDWYSSFLEITIDGVKSNYGVDSTMLTDDTRFTFTYTSLGGDE